MSLVAGLLRFGVQPLATFTPLTLGGFMHPQNQAPPGPYGQAPYPGGSAPGVAPAAPVKKKSSVWKWVGFGCGGCSLVLLILCGIGGYLVYLEEGQDRGEPGEEVASVPVNVGAPVAWTYPRDTTGYATHYMWLDVTGREAMGQFVLTGNVSCGQTYGGYPRDVRVSLLDSWDIARLERRPDGSFSAWIRVHDEYDHSSSQPGTCMGTFQAEVGQIEEARLVVTRFERPSDMF